MDTKQKYVKIRKFDAIIIFPEFLEHSSFRQFEVVSAGFCYVDHDNKKVNCFGESYSLNLKHDTNDSLLATKQIFGTTAMLELLK